MACLLFNTGLPSSKWRMVLLNGGVGYQQAYKSEN